jgi:hypothetical protein
VSFAGSGRSIVAIAWTLLQGESWDAFRAALPLDRANSDLLSWELAAQCLRTGIEMNRKTEELLTGRLVERERPRLRVAASSDEQPRAAPRSGHLAPIGLLSRLPFGQGWLVRNVGHYVGAKRWSLNRTAARRSTSAGPKSASYRPLRNGRPAFGPLCGSRSAARIRKPWRCEGFESDQEW